MILGKLKNIRFYIFRPSANTWQHRMGFLGDSVRLLICVCAVSRLPGIFSKCTQRVSCFSPWPPFTPTQFKTTLRQCDDLWDLKICGMDPVVGGKDFTPGSMEVENLWFAAFVTFCGVNSPTMADFMLPLEVNKYGIGDLCPICSRGLVGGSSGHQWMRQHSPVMCGLCHR